MKTKAFITPCTRETKSKKKRGAASHSSALLFRFYFFFFRIIIAAIPAAMTMPETIAAITAAVFGFFGSSPLSSVTAGSVPGSSV